MSSSYLDIFKSSFMPKERIPMIPWLEKYRILSDVSSSESGPYSVDRTPYVKKILEALDNPEIEELYVEKGVQLGITEIAVSRLSYLIAEKPRSILYVLPTLDMSKKFSMQRIAPMIRDTPIVSEKMQQEISGLKKTDNVLTKNFKGGMLSIVCSNSSSSLRSLPVQEAHLDEIDEYPVDLMGQGDIVDIIRGRFHAQRYKKIFVLSTPTVEGISRIDDLFYSADQQRFHVPCPRCNAFNYWKFKDFKWERGVPESIVWVCPACQFGVEEKYKQPMMLDHQWIADHPERSGKIISFHIPSFCSPPGWFSWTEIAEKFEAINGSLEKEKSFKNLVLGEVYSPRVGGVPDHKALFNRRETYKRNTIPKGAGYILVSAADIQADRIELEIVVFSSGTYQSTSIDYRIFYGNTADPDDECWDKMEKLLTEEFLSEDGTYKLTLSGIAIDTGFNTQTVYTWCRRHAATKKVFPIKGVGSDVPVSAAKFMDLKRNGQRIRNGLRVWQVGVGILKSEFYNWLLQESPSEEDIKKGIYPSGWCRFPNYDESYFQSLTSETLISVKDPKNGRMKQKWVVRGNNRRNEALDIRIYIRACYFVLGFDSYKAKDWKELEINILGNRPVVNKIGEENKEESFWKNEPVTVWE